MAVEIRRSMALVYIQPRTNSAAAAGHLVESVSHGTNYTGVLMSTPCWVFCRISKVGCSRNAGIGYREWGHGDREADSASL